MKRGDIYWAQLVPRSGSEQQGHRPAIVVSHDAFNQTPNWHSVIVVPVTTSTSQAARGATVVALPAGAGGLKKASTALCHQVTTLDRTKLGQFIGTLNAPLLRRVDDGLKAAMQLR